MIMSGCHSLALAEKVINRRISLCLCLSPLSISQFWIPYSSKQSFALITGEIFKESCKMSDFSKHGISLNFVRDDLPVSHKSVVRMPQFQKKPFGRGKLLSVLSGKILDFASHIRSSSEIYGKDVFEIPSAINCKLPWVPCGFAHGFLVLEYSKVHYEVTGEHNKKWKGGIIWHDPLLNVSWQVSKPLLTEGLDSQLWTVN